MGKIFFRFSRPTFLQTGSFAICTYRETRGLAFRIGKVLVPQSASLLRTGGETLFGTLGLSRELGARLVPEMTYTGAIFSCKKSGPMESSIAAECVDASRIFSPCQS